MSAERGFEWPGSRPAIERSRSSATSGSFVSTASTPCPERESRASSAPIHLVDRRGPQRQRSLPRVRRAPSATRSPPSWTGGWRARSTCRTSPASSTSGRPVTSAPASGECDSTGSSVTTSHVGSRAGLRGEALAAQHPDHADGAPRRSGRCGRSRRATPQPGGAGRNAAQRRQDLSRARPGGVDRGRAAAVPDVDRRSSMGGADRDARLGPDSHS